MKKVRRCKEEMRGKGLTSLNRLALEEDAISVMDCLIGIAKNPMFEFVISKDNDRTSKKTYLLREIIPVHRNTMLSQLTTPRKKKNPISNRYKLIKRFPPEQTETTTLLTQNARKLYKSTQR